MPPRNFASTSKPKTFFTKATAARKRLTKFTDVRLIRRMLRDAQHRNHSPLLTILHWHYVRAGELFSIIPLSGMADHVVNGGFPFDLPALKPFFIGPERIVAAARRV